MRDADGCCLAAQVYGRGTYVDERAGQNDGWQPSAAAAETLASWCQRLGVVWLTKTLENAGHRTVSDLKVRLTSTFSLDTHFLIQI